MPNKVDRIRRLRAALEAIGQGIEQPAAGQIALDAVDTDNYLADNPQNVVDDQKETERQP
ncbi:MAG: hypothetical protein WBW73_29425 [Rhodoplanes sp.]